MQGSYSNIFAGASSDLKQATSIAQHMVKDWGMSEKVGLRTIEGPKGLSNGDILGPNTNEMVGLDNVTMPFGQRANIHGNFTG